MEITDKGPIRETSCRLREIGMHSPARTPSQCAAMTLDVLEALLLMVLGHISTSHIYPMPKID
jgi:hypothetical protein